MADGHRSTPSFWQSSFWRHAALALSLGGATANTIAAALLLSHGDPMGVVNVGFVAMSPILYRVMTS